MVAKQTNYFSQEVEEAIQSFNKIQDKRERDKVYEKKIYPALWKLSENLINILKISYADELMVDLQHELVVFFTEKLERINPEYGKAFSYFTKIGRHYLIARNIKGFKLAKEKVSEIEIDTNRDIVNEVFKEEFRSDLSYFIEQWVTFIDLNLEGIFPIKEEQIIVDSILELFRERENLVTYNKSRLYILIRERSNVETRKITKVVNRLKLNYIYNFNRFNKGISLSLDYEKGYKTN